MGRELSPVARGAGDRSVIKRERELYLEVVSLDDAEGRANKDIIWLSIICNDVFVASNDIHVEGELVVFTYRDLYPSLNVSVAGLTCKPSGVMDIYRVV